VYSSLALARAGSSVGRTPVWCEILHRQREHPIPDVRAAALATAIAR
jgi:hypothetical protein